MKMAVAPTILRTKPKLSDYLFEQDKTKFKLPKKSSRPWIINNANDKSKLKDVLDDNLVTDFENIVSIHRGADPSMFLEKTLETGKGSGNESENYLNCAQGNRNNTLTHCDNEMTHRNENLNKKNLERSSCKLENSTVSNLNHGSNNKRSRKSPKSQRKYQANSKSRFGMQYTETEDETEEDRLKRQLLERDIELEYQQQVNKMFNNQQSAHLLDQVNQGNQNLQFYQEQNQYIYPPLYLQGPQGLYYVLVPPPDSYVPDYPGSTGDLSDVSESEGSDDGESLQDMSEEPMRSIHDADWTQDQSIEPEDLTKYGLKNCYENLIDFSEEISEEEYSMQNDEELTNLVLSIIDE